MKHRILPTVLLAVLLLCIPAAYAATADYTCFPQRTWFRIESDLPGCSFEAAFYADGYLDGVDTEGEEVSGRYMLRADGSLIAIAGPGVCELQPQKNGSYSGTVSADESTAACGMTKITEKAFRSTMKAAGLDLPIEDERKDMMPYDYPVFATVALPEGIPLQLSPLRSDFVLTVLPEGTMVRILGSSNDGGYMVEADGVRGFTPDEEYEDLPVHHAKVVRTGKDKGKSVNLRQTPEYIDNVICEVRYGETVDIFPVVRGDFTLIYYDHAEGWMTTVRLKPID